MALKDFDIAFTDKIKAWYSNTIYANTAIVYNVAYNLVDDPTTELRFPLISIYRPGGFSLINTQTFAARKRGIEYYYDDENNVTGFARFVVANLPYQIDIYSKSPEDLDDITENIMHALNLDQKLQVTQIDSKNDKEYVESYDIIYNSGPQEQSEFQSGDRVYHYSLAYDIPNARLLNFRNVGDVTTIIPVTTMEDSDGNTVDTGDIEEGIVDTGVE